MGAEIDSIEVKISSSAKQANDAIDSIIKGLGKLEGALNIDTSKLRNIGKSLDVSGLTKSAQSIKNQSKEITRSLDEIYAKYKDLGKGFQLKGDTKYLQKQIDSLSNSLAKANLRKEELETSGKVNSQGYEDAVKNVIKYENQIESLKKQLKSVNDIDVLPEFKIHGIESSKKELSDFQKTLDVFKNDFKALENAFGGISNIPESNIKALTDGLKTSAENVKQSFPEAKELISDFGNELKKLKDISSSFSGTENTPKIDIDTSSIEKAGKKIEELRNKFSGSGLDYNFFGNLDQIDSKLSELESHLERLKQKEKESISSGEIDTSGFEKLQERIVDAENHIKVLQALKERTEDFNRSIGELTLPPIQTDNLKKLQDEYTKTIDKSNQLRAELRNGITMGRITENVDDSGFRKLIEQIELADKKAKALEQKIKEVGNSSSSDKVSKFGKGLKSLASFGRSAGSALKKAANSILGVSTSASKSVRPINKLSNSFKGLLRTILPILGIRQLFNWGKQSIEVASDLAEVQNVVDVAFGNFKDKIEDFSNVSIQDFGMSPLTAKQIAGRFQSMGTAMGFSQGKMADMSVELTKLSADMASFYNVEQEDVAKSLQSVFSGTTMPLRKYGLDLTQATLQEWALKQGLDADIKSMTQAEKAMLRYQYVMANTSSSQKDFQRTSENWANQVRVLKQNFQQLAGVIGGTLINAFKPLVRALNTAMGYIIAFAKTISNALGKIFGWTYQEGGGSGGMAQEFEDAADGAGAIEDATGGAADNIKEMKAGLRAFDELKTIEMPKPSDGGSGGGAGGGGGLWDAVGAYGGQWVQTDNLLKGFESNIDNLYKLGDYISESLIKAMERIDWDSVYKKARGFGKGLASFLNGLFADQNGITLFGEIGKTIAGALNTVIYSALSFGQTFDFEQFGYNIADGINNFFKTFDFKSLANTLNVWAKGILNAAISAVDNTDWEQIGRSIGEFLQTLDIIDVLGKIGTLVKKVAKAFTDAWTEAFKKSPIETFLVSLVAMPKALKAIVSSKFVTGIAKITSKFVTFAENAKLVTTALMGNQNSMKTLLTQFPKFGKVVDVARHAFANFRFGIENGNFMTGLNEGIKTIRNSMTGLQKGITTAVSGFAEFSVVSNTFEGLVKGSEDLVSGIAKISAAAAAAGVAMYTALGPAGLALTAVVGVVGAVKGIDDAFDEIHAEELGQRLKESLTNPGGTPLEDVVSKVSDSIRSVGDSFSIINEKSESLKSSRKNIENVWLEIEQVRTSMKNGVISVEEGTERLNQLFQNLSETAYSSFDELELTLIAAFGENGVVSQVYQELGIDTQDISNNIVKTTADIKSEIQRLTEELANTDPTSPKYGELLTDLYELTGGYGDVEKALSDYALAVDSTSIDYGKILGEDGTVNTSYLTGALSTLTSAMGEAQDGIGSGVENIRASLEQYKNAALAVGDEESAARYQEAIDKIPEVLGSVQGDIQTQGLEITNAIQEYYVGGINNVIQDAGNQWEEMNPLERLFAGDKGTYIDEAVRNYQNNVLNPISDEIESSMNELGISGAGWARSAGDEVVNGLFESTGGSSGDYAYYSVRLKDNYTDVVSNAIENSKKEVNPKAEEFGKNTVTGFNSGIESEQSVTDSVISGWMAGAEIAMHNSAMKFGSPSKTAENFGKDTVTGFNQGISGNQGKTTTVISSWMTLAKGANFGLLVNAAGGFARDTVSRFNSNITGNVSSTVSTISSYMNRITGQFSGIVRPMSQIGEDAMSGFYNGITSVAGSLYKKVGDIANNVANTLRSALDIHSPSKVMFEIGDFTMQGFQEGMESLYKPIISSMKDFSYNLQAAPTIGTRIVYSDYDGIYNTYTPRVDEYGYRERYTSGQDNSETNELLRQQNELLRAILAKPNLGNDDIFNAAKAVYKGEARRRYGNSAAFDPVWG